MVALQAVQRHLPEVMLRFPTLNPFFGSPAQGMQVRELSDYSEVQPLFADSKSSQPGNRRILIKAKWVPDDPDQTEVWGSDSNERKESTASAPTKWCVLKGFDHGDEKRLQRS